MSGGGGRPIILIDADPGLDVHDGWSLECNAGWGFLGRAISGGGGYQCRDGDDGRK